jgi:hypothetical protein
VQTGSTSCELQRDVSKTGGSDVAEKLNRERHGRSNYGPLVSEIKTLLYSFEQTIVRAVWRTGTKLLIKW